MQAQQALAAKDRQTSFYSHWNGGGLFDSGDTRSPTSTSPPTPLAIHPNPPASITSSQEGARSPVQTTAQANPHNTLGSLMDSFRSPTQTPTQMDQPTSSIQPRVRGKSSTQHASPGSQLGRGQSPIGSHVLHRKSSSMDSGRVPASSPLNGFKHIAGGNPSTPNRGGKPSPRSQHAQHAATMSSGDGPIASLLGLNASNGHKADGNARSLKSSKSLHFTGARVSQNAAMNGHNITSLLPQGILDSIEGNSPGTSWMQQQPSASNNEMNHGNEFSYSGNQGMSHHANAFQRQLHISNSVHENLR